MDNFKKLEEAYSNDEFNLKIQKKMLCIEKEISKFIEVIRSNPDIHVSKNLEYRIKSRMSFLEKVKRKSYDETWILPNDTEEIEKVICKNLPDLIGFRIKCMFFEDELNIYNAIKKYYNDQEFSELITLNFNENTKQKNGHKIYKVSGNLEDFNFEIQIKCSLHDVWGEVEHKQIYKGIQYDPQIKEKKIITEGIFSVLESSDLQLKAIFEHKTSLQESINSLFFQYTFEQISNEANSVFLANHYLSFFEIFKEKEYQKHIQIFLSKKLNGDKYQKIKMSIQETTSVSVKEFINRYAKFDLEVVNGIASVLYDGLNFEDFIKFLICKVENISINDDEDDAALNISFNDDEDDDTNDISSEKEAMKNNIFSIYDKSFTKHSPER
jgi:ppGpp synthetase/RelA/SpoT-type nucleotidyltranferase